MARTMRGVMMMLLLGAGCVDSAEPEVVLENTTGKGDSVAARVTLTGDAPAATVTLRCDNWWFACNVSLSIEIQNTAAYADAMRWLGGGSLDGWLSPSSESGESRLPVASIELPDGPDGSRTKVPLGIAVRSLRPLVLDGKEAFELEVPPGEWATIRIERTSFLTPSEHRVDTRELAISASW